VKRRSGSLTPYGPSHVFSLAAPLPLMLTGAALRLRGLGGGATMTAPGVTRTRRFAKLFSQEFPSARLTGCLKGSEPPRYSPPEATGLRSFALALSPVPMP
jgi:hypothetical protein